VSISTNNGRSFTELSSVPITKTEDLTIDLKAKIPRRYAYWIKIELTEQAGLDAFEIEDDIQHAPRTLPWLGKSCLDRDLQRSRICGQNHLVGKQVHVLTACSNQGAEAMTRIHGVIAAGLLTLAGGIGISVGRAQQDQGAAEKVGSKLDEAGRSIKKGLEEARDAIREQFARVRGSVHNMDVASRVYGRLHWDKTLTTSTLDLDVQGGVATLRGAVPNAKAKAKAVELAEDTVGISKVIDQLTIQQPPRTTPDTSSDATPKT